VKNKLGYWSSPYDRAFFMDEVGQTYEKLRRPSDAVRAFEDALSYNPHYSLARFHLASLFKATGHPADARDGMQSFLSEWKDADPGAAEVVAARQMLGQLPRSQ
jgi:hypothetical protein